MSSIPKELLIVLTRKKNGKILDLGSGEGTTMVTLARLGFNVHGIEISKEGVRKTKKRAKRIGTRVKITRRDMYKKLPFKNETFDVIVGLQSINHNRLSKIVTLLEEAIRVLKPGGIIVVKTANIESYKLEQIRGNIYRDVEFNEDFEFIDKQTYVPLSGSEKGIIHYAFYKNELENILKNLNLHKIKSKILKWHILAIYEKNE